MAVPVELAPREETAKRDMSALYERDTYSWAMQQAEALRRRDLGSVDWEHIIEEIEDLGQSSRNCWESNCAQAITHMLKIDYWELAETSNLRHWVRGIRSSRMAMARTIRRNPGLEGSCSEMFLEAWSDGRHSAIVAMASYESDRGAPASTRDLERGWDRLLPGECPYSLEEVTAFDPKREQFPRAEWPPSVADMLTLRLYVKHHVVEPAPHHRRRRR